MGWRVGVVVLLALTLVGATSCSGDDGGVSDACREDVTQVGSQLNNSGMPQQEWQTHNLSLSLQDCTPEAWVEQVAESLSAPGDEATVRRQLGDFVRGATGAEADDSWTAADYLRETCEWAPGRDLSLTVCGD